MTSITPPDAIQWYEGMLLAPQHFQQSAARQESLVHYHSRLIAPFHWGVLRLEVDTNVLVDGTFRVEALEAVLPDGLTVTYGPEDESPLEADLSEHAEEGGSVTVFLALPAKGTGGSPVSGDLARYDSVEGALVTDENTGDGELRIPRLKPRIRLLLSDDLPQKFVGFPLARLSYASEVFALTDYQPPSLRVPVTSALGQLCQSLAQRLREKASYLAEQARSPSMTARAPQLLAQKNLIHGLVSALPAFEATLATGLAHPYAVYLGLCSIAGQVAGLSRALVPPVFDPYDHDDPRASFESVTSFIYQAVREGIVEGFTGFPFQWVDGAFRLELDPSWSQRTLFLGVRSAQGITENRALDWVERALIGARDRIAALRGKRIRGAARQRQEGEADLVPSQGVQLFGLSTDPEFVVPGEVLEIRNLDDPRARPLEIVLWVRNAPYDSEE